MIVVHQSVFDSRRREGRRKMRFPDAFGEPCAARAHAEVTLKVVGESRDLFEAIGRRNRYKNRLVKSTTEQFDLSVANQRSQAIEVRGAMALDPFEKAAAEMHAEADRRMLREHIEKGQIALRVGALDHIVEVADGLVRVDEESQLELTQCDSLRDYSRITEWLSAAKAVAQIGSIKIVAAGFDSRLGV